MKCDQRALRFNCQGSSMVGIIDLPERPFPRGVLVAAGHPYSRLGARRQFAMLARALARRGIAVMRFDRRGVGDSEGCDNNDSDVRAALQEFCDQVPALQEVVLLTPGGSAAIATARACAAGDARIRGLLLLTPWRRGNRRRPPQLDAVADALADGLADDAALQSQRPGRRAATGAPSLTLVSSTDAAARYWRRAAVPRPVSRRNGERNLAVLAEQLSSFPGPVLVVASDAGMLRHLPAARHADPVPGAPAPAHLQQRRAELGRLASLVTRAGAGDRVRIIGLPAASEAPQGEREADRPDCSSLTGACADWLISW